MKSLSTLSVILSNGKSVEVRLKLCGMICEGSLDTEEVLVVDNNLY